VKLPSEAPADDTPVVKTEYYRWDLDACRRFIHESGRTTADRYRPEEGFTPIDPCDLEFEATPISEAHYRYLVQMDDACEDDDTEIDAMEWVIARICGVPQGEALPPLTRGDSAPLSPPGYLKQDD
jgi:hypothetical protein